VSVPSGPVLRAVDRGAFVVALGERLRSAGVPVTFTALSALTEGLGASAPRDLDALYWLLRITLVNRHQDLPTFDRVFDEVFLEAALPVEGQASGPMQRGDLEDNENIRGAGASPVGAAEETTVVLPWHARLHEADDGEADGELVVPELMPSAVRAVAEVPFDELDEHQLALVGAWIERSLPRWPQRVSRRRRVVPGGRRIALRETIARSRRTGWEAVELSRTRAVRRPRSLTMLVDVSESMRAYSTAYLHVMRALARTGRAETFAFSTSLTRLTPALRDRSASTAMELASEQVTDRYGGTRLATCLAELLASRHGQALRGGVLVVCSDGWDSDDPALLARAMKRARLRAYSVVWLNPRVAAPGFEPLVGSMATALPYCDAFLPAHHLRAVLDGLDVIVAPVTGPVTTTA
jgi:uncharacterized protein with von Willebrand factor type A (vWA) domain